MSKEGILSILPYVLMYILIFKDPYSAIIPVSEPALRYSSETTWLLDENSSDLDFAHAYNRHFEKEITDSNNAFGYFLAAFCKNDVEFGIEIAALGDNQTIIPINADSILVEAQSILKIFEDQTLYQELEESVNKQQNKSDYTNIIDNINIPEQNIYYHEPLFSTIKEQSLMRARCAQYILYLNHKANDKQQAVKALQQLRLLAHSSNIPQRNLCILTYANIVTKLNIDSIELLEIEQTLPDWPSIHELFDLRRASICLGLCNPNPRFDQRMEEQRKKSPDFFLDRNALLSFSHEMFNTMKDELPDKIINQFSEEDHLKLLTYIDTDNIIEDKRTMAEQMLFAGNIKERDQRAGRQVAPYYWINEIMMLQLNSFALEELSQDNKDQQNGK